jgi:opacity protein-like surface antigen
MKTRRLLFVFLTLFPLILFCQNTDTLKQGKISIGVTFSPDYGYRVLNTSKSDSWIADSRDTLEIPKFGYTAGVNLALRITKRISIEAGLQYSDKCYQTKNITLVAITPSGKPDTTAPVKAKFTYHYIYLDIPIKINYYLLTHRAKLYLTAGVSPGILLGLKTKATMKYRDGHSETNKSSTSSDLRTISLTAIAGLGFSYDVTNRIYFKIEPVGRCSMIPIVAAPIKEYLYSIGVNVGVYYRM